MSEDTSPCSSTLSYASPECEHRRMPQQLPSWVRFSEVRSGPAQGRPFIPLDALRRYLKRARWSVGIEESPESRDWKGVGDPALADLGRQCTFMRKTIAMDSEHVKACERERSLLESLGQSRHRHIFSILLFVGQLGCAIPLGTYKPLHKGSPEILGKQDRGFIPDSLHMELPQHIPPSLLQPGPELFVLSVLTFGALVTMTYRFHKFDNTKDRVFKGILALGLAGCSLSYWMDIRIPHILVPLTVSMAFLLSIVFDEVRSCWTQGRGGHATEFPEKQVVQEG